MPLKRIVRSQNHMWGSMFERDKQTSTTFLRTLHYLLKLCDGICSRSSVTILVISRLSFTHQQFNGIARLSPSYFPFKYTMVTAKCGVSFRGKCDSPFASKLLLAHTFRSCLKTDISGGLLLGIQCQKWNNNLREAFLREGSLHSTLVVLVLSINRTRH